LGKKGREQKLVLGKGCETFGVIAHELGHALGLFHTMNRPDRDYYIQLHLHNMQYACREENGPDLILSSGVPEGTQNLREGESERHRTLYTLFFVIVITPYYPVPLIPIQAQLQKG
ncbi:astacin, partial [Oesophagostomum dentatum]